MKCHGKLLSFLAVWFVAVVGAFWLPTLEIFAGVCNECDFCEQLNYASVVIEDTYNIGYFDNLGISAPQAFDGGAFDDSSVWIYKAANCLNGGQKSTDGSVQLSTTLYGTPNLTCDLPEGASTSYYQEFNSGMNPQPQPGTVDQYQCGST
jgi:hypothetical protein